MRYASDPTSSDISLHSNSFQTLLILIACYSVVLCALVPCYLMMIQDEGAHVPCLSTDDELVVRYYCGLIAQICGDEEGMLNKSWRMKATAVQYFRIFYANGCSLQQYDPRNIMLACLFVAGKIEDDYVDSQSLLKYHNKCSVEALMKAEMELLEGLKFELKLFHAHNCAHGFITDIRITVVDPFFASNKERYSDIDKAAVVDKLRHWNLSSTSLINNVLVTSFYGSMKPNVLAIFSLIETAPNFEGIFNVQSYFSSRIGEIFPTLNITQLKEKYYEAMVPQDATEIKRAIKSMSKSAYWSK